MNKNIETRIKQESEYEMERCPELKELILSLAAELKSRGSFSQSLVPDKYAYHVGCYFLDEKLVRYALENDPDLEELRTFEGRENANYHTLNEWLGEDPEDQRNSGDAMYVVLAEKCRKENETFVWFLQWTGNEDEIRKLDAYLQAVTESDEDYEGDISTYTLDITHTVSKQTAKEMCKVSVWYYMSPEMLSGKFKGLGLDYEKPSARDLDRVFYVSHKKALFE
jgi:hypothetical protein